MLRAGSRRTPADSSIGRYNNVIPASEARPESGLTVAIQPLDSRQARMTAFIPVIPASEARPESGLTVAIQPLDSRQARMTAFIPVIPACPESGCLCSGLCLPKAPSAGSGQAHVEPRPIQVSAATTTSFRQAKRDRNRGASVAAFACQRPLRLAQGRLTSNPGRFKPFGKLTTKYRPLHMSFRQTKP